MKGIGLFVGKALIFAAASALPALAGGTYVLGGLVGAITGGGSYGWEGSSNAAFRSALQTASYFGPSGTITTTVSTVNITSTASLGGIQGLVVPWWYNTSSTPT